MLLIRELIFTQEKENQGGCVEPDMEVEVECQLAIGSHSNGKTKSMENGSIIKEKRQHQKRVLLLKGKREI